MKRVVTSAVVITASLGILLGGAGTAAAQDPYDKYQTKNQCQIAGGLLVSSGSATRYSCVSHPESPARQRWWLYVV